MKIVASVSAMQRHATQWRYAGVRIGFVPTMGYLHAGHMSLVHEARKRVGKSGRVVVSIYVNPTQFGPSEDLSRYPRDLKCDLQLCRAAGVDAVFTPDDAQMYPTGKNAAAASAFSTYVVEGRLSQSMEGVTRPTHFRGVTTVVAKLFNLVLPDVAVFGAKDWQQATIIRRMVADLNFPVQIVVAPTVRETDGLALSSRNKYLDAEQRAQATILHRTIQQARQAAKTRPVLVSRLKKSLAKFIATAPLARLDYLEFFDSDTLQPARRVQRGTHLALAVYFGKTRLIDNARL